MLNVSDKAVSKWERGQGLPDVSLLPELSNIFGIDIERLLDGELSQNTFAAGNLKKTKYYVCPVCGNISICTGNTEVSCCSRKIKETVPQKPDEAHMLNIDKAEDEWLITSVHEMKKDHYISFIAFASDDRLHVIKQYPEWNIETRAPIMRHGVLLWYCTRHGLFYKNI